MKKLLLATAAFLLLAAIPAMAYVQPGSLQQKSSLNTTQAKSKSAPIQKDFDESQSGSQPGVATEQTTSGYDPLGAPPPQEGDAPTQPVPEPGTMAMASMGLLAIGAALRHKRGR